MLVRALRLTSAPLEPSIKPACAQIGKRHRQSYNDHASGQVGQPQGEKQPAGDDGDRKKHHNKTERGRKNHFQHQHLVQTERGWLPPTSSLHFLLCLTSLPDIALLIQIVVAVALIANIIYH
ncbi:MAG: hypothetical protein Q4G24_02050 [Paracoccus sp. (in: a-proteobacteria)]|uniref:hypothetical protein n=1 Tax=Paracoccus sp. TaxID=267 RepID=UPI0026DF9E51|nr:hypothetical protein [Paracoccus sp. (in: a-proteobacteria)]MDO5620234.1 hypothetical protein [Paracoccus sp. (in: a-proteobacteria)]